MIRAVAAASVLLALPGCALLTVKPPTVEVESVQLATIGATTQQFDVVLCATNPNGETLRFTSIRAAIDVAGAPLADSVSDSAVILPPHASVRVPFTVATTLSNLGPQIASVFGSGAIDYRLHGTVRIAEPVALTLPFARSGHLDVLASVPDLLSDAAAGGDTGCGVPGSPVAAP